MFKQIKDRLSPVLSDREIVRRIRKGELFETPLSSIQIQPNSVDLTLGKTWTKPRPNDFYLGEPIVNSAKPIESESGEMEIPERHASGFNNKATYALRSREFVLFASNETLNIPNGILAFVQGRSSIARLGIQTEQAGLIDAGFRGTITFEVYNESPYTIYLMEGMRVAQVYFFRAQRSARLYGTDLASKYSGQQEATASRIHMDLQDRPRSPQEIMDEYWAMPFHHVKTHPPRNKDR